MLAAEAERAEAGVEALVDDRAEKPDRAARARAKDLADLRALERSGRCWRNTCCDRETGRAVEPNRRDAMRAGAARGGAGRRSSPRAHQSSGRMSTDALLQPVYSYVSSPHGMRFHPSRGEPWLRRPR